VKKNKILRSDIQFAFFIIAILLTINSSLTAINSGISWLISTGYIHYVCPICGVTIIYQYLVSSANFLTKISNPAMMVVGMSIIVAILFGPIFCGWICPFGGFQDFIATTLGKRVSKKKFNRYISEKADSILKWNRYVILVLVIYMTAKSYVTVLENINPYHALLNLFIGEFSIIGLVILGLVVVASLFVQRPWCKYFCPYGAFLGLFNLVRIKAIVRKDTSCVHCKMCEKNCPMNIKMSNQGVVRDVRCISCMECTSGHACPKEDTLKMAGTKGKDKAVKLNAKFFGAVVIFLVLLVMYLFSVVSNSTSIVQDTTSADSTETESMETASSTNRAKSDSSPSDDAVAGDFSSESSSDQKTTVNYALTGNYADGTYTGEGTGYNPGLVVEVTIADNKITEIEIVSNNETIGYCDSALEQIPDEIVEAQSTDVDAISGATKTSNGIIEAVNNALEQAKQ